MRVKNKPVVVEAVQWHGFHAKQEFDEKPDWLTEALGKTILYFGTPDKLDFVTLEGKIYADVGDWIIRGVKGELYPCKPDIFKETYEPADGGTL